jgi:hypothetical protein
MSQELNLKVSACPAPVAAARETDDLVIPPLGCDAGATSAEAADDERRLSEVDRRTGLDRRQKTAEEAKYTGPERRKKARRDTTGLERRRGAGIRRSEERKAAEEGEMNSDQFEFVMAVEAYKKVNKKLYPTWTEILEVMKQLGYRKVQPREVKLENVPEAPLEKAA